jgi:hypothetical protein
LQKSKKKLSETKIKKEIKALYLASQQENDQVKAALQEKEEQIRLLENIQKKAPTKQIAEAIDTTSGTSKTEDSASKSEI